MSYFELNGMVDDLGYTNITKMHYNIPCKSLNVCLRYIVSDIDVTAMIKESKLTGGDDVYTEHSDHLEQIEHHEVTGNEQVNEYLNVSDGVSESDGYYSEINSNAESNDSLDSVNLDVSDDEELVEVMKKKVELNQLKNKTQSNQPTNANT